MSDHHRRTATSVWIVLLLLACASSVTAKHMRLYACVLADNTPGNFLGASSLGSGLWVSNDTGRSWNHLGWKHGKTYSVRIPKYGKGNTIFLARGDGLLRSTDAGATWRMLTDWRQTEILDVGALEADPAFLIISTATGMWRSQDSGKTWMKLTKGVESRFVSRIEFHPKYPNRMAAATEKGLFTSNDRGESWRLSSSESDSASMHYVFYSSDVRLHWVGERGEVQGEKMYPLYNEDLIGKMWCIEELAGRYAVCGPKGTFIVSNRDEEPIEMDTTIKNPHTLCAVGNKLFVGSLGGGITMFDLSAGIPKRLTTSLPNAEVWTIRKQEVD